MLHCTTVVDAVVAAAAAAIANVTYFFGDLFATVGCCFQMQ
jgi:hypothetical protein